MLSRKMLSIPNKHVQNIFDTPELEGMDGELIVGSPTDKRVFNTTQSAVMRIEGEPDVHWYIFDNFAYEGKYVERAHRAKQQIGLLAANGYHNIHWLGQKLIRDYDELRAEEEHALQQGYEGLILRSGTAPYKQNRSTLREGYLLKVKRFEDSEAEILECIEQQRNENEATVDERGYTKRSSAASGKVNAGILGAFRVRDIVSGVEFEVGTGFTAEQRANLWAGRKYLPGKLIKYKHFAVGVKDKPRFPTFIGFRDKRDM